MSIISPKAAPCAPNVTHPSNLIGNYEQVFHESNFSTRNLFTLSKFHLEIFSWLPFLNVIGTMFVSRA